VQALSLSEGGLFRKGAARKIKDLAATQARETELWNKWKHQGEKPKDLTPLLRSYNPLIRKKANQFVGNVDLPPAAIHAEFQHAALNAFRRYDPNKGAALNTWVNINLKKAQRWVSKYQNVARIQENRQYKIGVFNNAKSTLDERLGREPTNVEMADHLGWGESDVSMLNKEIRKALPTSGFEGGFDPTTISPNRDSEKLKLIKYELNPEECLVYEYTIGDSGKPMLKPGEIARKLKMSPSKVSRIRNSITSKLEQY
jgi:RNA polymerase primary sigma factor